MISVAKGSLSVAVVAVFMLAGSRGAAAEDAPAQTSRRACAAADLSGTYTLIAYSERPSAGFRNGAQSGPFQFMAFAPEGTWAKMAYNRPPPRAS